ncbi:MAG: hypothetical protein JW881_17280, partial [Spirochaetales bacterium]|nr:hypothetical protein [Spirochaetales bacterium]
MKGVLILMSFVLFVLIAGCDLETAHESISPAKAEVSTSLGVTCVNCIIGNRPDILPFYESNGWDIDESNWVAIINNWCSVDPEGCAEEMRKCEGFCSSSQPPPQTTSLPASTVPVELCAVSYVECIIANR